MGSSSKLGLYFTKKYNPKELSYDGTTSYWDSSGEGCISFALVSFVLLLSILFFVLPAVFNITWFVAAKCRVVLGIVVIIPWMFGLGALTQGFNPWYVCYILIKDLLIKLGAGK